MQYEDEHIKYKAQITDDIFKEVVAFANTDGGVIYIGIDNQGKMIGIDNIDETYTRLTNGIRDSISPDVTMFVRYTLQENKVIKIEVCEGSYKPYYIKSKGIKPTGVYVRQGASSVRASSELIRQMIKESDGDSFEENRSIIQELTFVDASKAFNLYGVEFAKEKFQALSIVDKKNTIYTNLAMFLSDQCVHTTKVAVFSDDACTTFRDSKEFSGSIFKQFENVTNYLALCNKTSSVINGIVRTDKQDYPNEAIREALLNAIVHRDYSFSGSIIINITDYKMEFISLGGLLSGLSPDDIRSGISQPRNKNLAEIFHRLRLIESYGTGIRRIFNLYANCKEQPKIEITPNTFKITLPNMNMCENEASSNATTKKTTNTSQQIKSVLNYLAKHKTMTDAELQKLLNIKQTRAYQIARQMNNDGLIDIENKGAKKRYKLK